MEAYSFSSLRDMLERPPSHNSHSHYPISKAQAPHENPPHVTEMFGELYFNESNSTSNRYILPQPALPPPPPPPSYTPPNRSLHTNSIENPIDKTNFGKDKVTEHGCIYNKKSWRKKEKLFPPPISCLKSAKSGDPFNYFRFDKNSSTFVPEEIRIPRQGLLRASRDSGRLKLNFADEEQEEEEDEEEENNGKEASDEEWEVVDFGMCVLDE